MRLRDMLDKVVDLETHFKALPPDRQMEVLQILEAECTHRNVSPIEGALRPGRGLTPQNDLKLRSIQVIFGVLKGWTIDINTFIRDEDMMMVSGLIAHMNP